MPFQTIRQLALQNKTVLLRADLNVPAQSGKVTDTTRIDRLKPTIDYLCDHGAKVLVLSHFGRPEGERNPQMSLAFLTPVLQQCWGRDVSFIPECIGPAAEKAAQALTPGQIAVLENVRFHKGEEANDPYFCQQLAALGDIYVNDAFSAAHRAHASTEGLAHLLPAAAGLLMTAELEALDRALGNPQRPVCAITGGSKISTKLSILKNLIDKVDVLILGGAMANTFLFAQGADVGGSLRESTMADEARRIMEYAAQKNCRILLPADSVCVKDIKPDADFEIVDSRKIPADMRAIDIGPAGIKDAIAALEMSKTLVWNGPLGVFEIKPFDAGTNALAHAAAALTRAGKLVSIAGGGDTVAALENAGAADDFTYISTAGGAFLEWLEGKTLPGVAALMKQPKAA